MSKVIDFPLNEKLIEEIQNNILSIMNLSEAMQNDKREEYSYFEVDSEGRHECTQNREQYLEDSMEIIWNHLESLNYDIRERTGIDADEKYENGAIM